jgi:hypothetical protein
MACSIVPEPLCYHMRNIKIQGLTRSWKYIGIYTKRKFHLHTMYNEKYTTVSFLQHIYVTSLTFFFLMSFLWKLLECEQNSVMGKLQWYIGIIVSHPENKVTFAIVFISQSSSFQQFVSSSIALNTQPDTQNNWLQSYTIKHLTLR